MERILFAEKIKGIKPDVILEYKRLYNKFYCDKQDVGQKYKKTIYELCENRFFSIPSEKLKYLLKDNGFDKSMQFTCLSLYDFMRYIGVHFLPIKDESSNVIGMPFITTDDVNEEYFVKCCEFTYNIVFLTCKNEKYLNYVEQTLDFLGYKKIVDGDYTLFIKEDNDICTISYLEEIKEVMPDLLNDDFILLLFKYKHNDYKNNIDKKCSILQELYFKIEKYKNVIDKNYSNDLFFLFNNLNIRHNNKEYISNLSNMSKLDLESWYNEIFGLCLLSVFDLCFKRKLKKVDELKNRLNTKIKP